MRRPGLLRRLTRLRPRDLTDFGRAQVAVLVAHWLVWRRPTGRLLAHTADGSPRLPERSAPIPPEVERLQRAVNRASVYGLTRPLCLTRAVALVRLLEARGLGGGMLRIGVRWEQGAFVAHAWVEYQGAVLDLDPRLSRPFVPLTDVRVASSERPS
ncbi:MAG TPA: lasso peptide biosynthesis B2 protein [Gemmatimonadaceae bacterium]|nr:lasso peptide biosynthesis B2 protein [Gemmatimonadaceae bacterium]